MAQLRCLSRDCFPGGKKNKIVEVYRYMSEFSLGNIGQIAVNVADLNAAVGFYREILGLKFLFQYPGMAFFNDPSGNTLALMSEIYDE